MYTECWNLIILHVIIIIYNTELINIVLDEHNDQ